MTSANVDRDWESKYREGNTPWDTGSVSQELRRVLSEDVDIRGRALELGCGTGTNAIFLATQGFDVTAVDCSALALTQARAKADEAGVSIRWIEADVQNLGGESAPPRSEQDASEQSTLDPVGQFDFVFDRGCYHCCRRVDLTGYLTTLRNVTRPGTVYLSLSGNANEQTEQGPPRLTDAEIRADFDSLFAVRRIREFYFEDPGGARGPLGWSALMVRHPA